MLTENQKKTFQKVKAGKLNKKQTADFYYRMSKILKNELNGIEEMTRLLNELPDNYLDKIDLNKITPTAMELTEKLVTRLDPSPYASRDTEGKYHIFRHYRVNLAGSIPLLGDATASVDVCYEATTEEVKFFSRLIDHIAFLEETYRCNERPNEILSLQEMEKRIKFATHGRPYTPRVAGLTGFPVDHDAIMKGDKPLHEILPDLDKIDLRGAMQKKEEPK